MLRSLARETATPAPRIQAKVRESHPDIETLIADNSPSVFQGGDT
jgi:hypothetical protein